MLSPDDAALVARDPAVSAMAELLDPERIEARLAAVAAPAWGAVGSARVVYLRYKPGISLTAGLVADTPGGRRHAYAVAGAADIAAKLAKPVGRRQRDDRDFAASLGEDLLLLAPVSMDASLKAAHRVLARPADIVPGAVRSTVLTYKPARRVVARLDGEDRPVAVARVQAQGEPSPAVAATARLADAGVDVPAARFRSDGRVTVVDYVEGQVPEDGTEPGLLGAVGSLLSRAHTAEPFEGARSADPERTAYAAVRAISVVLPEAAGLAATTAARAISTLGRPARVVLVHGDLSVDQVLAHGAGLTLLDLDRVRLDDPAADAASWFAAEAVAGRWGPETDPVGVMEPMTRAYAAGSARRLEDGLRPLAALALLQRAVEPFRVRQPAGTWSDSVAALVGGAAVQAGAR